MTTRTQTLLNTCPMCGKPSKTMYCSPSCKQAAYRQRQGAQVLQRADGQVLGNVEVHDNDHPLCALKGCENPTALGKRARYMMYCSTAHKQKAKRQLARQRFIDGVTRTPTLSEEPPLRYFRKGKGVIHLAPLAGRALDAHTFCGQDVSVMDELSNAEVHDTCKRCADVRDNQTWWSR